MQEKIIQIPFNRAHFTASQKSMWTLLYKKRIRQLIIYTLLCFYCLHVGFDFDKNDPASFVKPLSLGYALYIFLAWLGILEKRIKFLKALKNSGDRYEKRTVDSTFTFNDNGIEYKDNEKSFQLSWHLVKPVIIFKDNMLISFKDPGVLMFVLSRAELGDSTYQELLFILKEKTG